MKLQVASLRRLYMQEMYRRSIIARAFMANPSLAVLAQKHHKIMARNAQIMYEQQQKQQVSRAPLFSLNPLSPLFSLTLSRRFPLSLSRLLPLSISLSQQQQLALDGRRSVLFHQQMMMESSRRNSSNSALSASTSCSMDDESVAADAALLLCKMGAVSPEADGSRSSSNLSYSSTTTAGAVVFVDEVMDMDPHASNSASSEQTLLSSKKKPTQEKKRSGLRGTRSRAKATPGNIHI